MMQNAKQRRRPGRRVSPSDDSMLSGRDQLSSGATTEMCSTDLALIPSRPIQYFPDLTYDMAKLLNFYATNYCVLPLTNDVPNNPFRTLLPMAVETPHIWSAVIASASRALMNNAGDGQQALVYRGDAYSSFREALVKQSSSSDMPQLLANILLIGHLEAMETATSHWRLAFRAAKTILGMEIDPLWYLHVSASVRAQFVMMAW